MTVEVEVLDDLVVFARAMLDSGDLEPWAAILRDLRDVGALDEEGAYWSVKLYNAFDSLGSAMGARRRWPSPEAWAEADDRATVIEFPCTQERRGLRGGKVGRHLDDYVGYLAGMRQAEWISTAIVGDDPLVDFMRLEPHLRAVWGVGRQTAFEWAEFLAKVCDVPVSAPDARLWESEGPRRALQRLYGNPSPTAQWLNERAEECRAHLAEHDVVLPWEDFETVICDFNVMRDGRYYVGRHLAALREEIDEAPEDERPMLVAAWERIVPEPWREIRPGIDRALLKVYRDSGRVITEDESGG